MKNKVIKNLPQLKELNGKLMGGFATLSLEELFSLRGGKVMAYNSGCHNTGNCSGGDNGRCTNSGMC